MPNPENLIGKGFVKGKSGNPAGKPKGIRNRSTIVKKWLLSKMEISDPIKKTKIKATVEDQLVLAQITKGMKGDTPAFNAVMDSAYGKPAQALDHTTNGESLNQRQDLSMLSEEELRFMIAIQKKIATGHAQ